MAIKLINNLSQPLKTAALFVAHNEKASGLSTTRFIQDTATCLVPKAVFSRSKEDLAENTFLELSESALVYFAPAFLGEKVFRKIYSKTLSKEAKNLVAQSASSLQFSKNPICKKILPLKAAIALSALFIPLTEFTLNYFKNLMTLKLFKKSDFNNIANLTQTKENQDFQKKVEKSAKKNIKRAASIFCGSLALGALIAHKGADSKFLQKISKLILTPGSMFFKKNSKAEKFFNKYFSLDFASEKGKLVLSKGQLTATVLIGGAGYFGASKDRGRQNFLETLFRFPVVGFYIITGSELFEKGFKKILLKKGLCKETINKNLKTPLFENLYETAKRIALQKNTSVEKEFQKLAKQKVFIFTIPFLFSIGVMGFFVAGISNLFTKYRFEKSRQKIQQPHVLLGNKNPSKTFEPFFR